MLVTARCHCDNAMSLTDNTVSLMAALDLQDSVLMTINGVLAGQRTMNTFWWRVTAITGSPDETVAFPALWALLGSAGFIDKYLACVPTNWTGAGVWMQSIYNLRQRKIVIPFDDGGTGVSEANTANVQGSITRVGDIARRDAVGGIRIPIPTNALATTNGLLTVAQKGAMDEFAAELPIVRTTVTPAVTYTPMVGAPEAANPANWFKVVAAFAQPETRVIRRRTVGRGI